MIGETFSQELEVAGLMGLPFSWSAAGDFQFGDMPQDKIDAVLAVVAAHDPEKKLPRDIRSEISALESVQMMSRVTREFMLAFTEASYTPEQLALNIGYTKLKAFDNEVRALRELL